MKRTGTKRSFFAMAVITLLLAIAMPATSFGKDHGRQGRGRDNRHWKCGKFVNCHDARDGRRDGRGPRADRVSDILRNRIRNRNRDFDNDGELRHQRNRNLNNDLLRDRRILDHDRDLDDDRGSSRHGRGRKNDRH
ncbi:MAG: hypothetical protein ABJC10_07790 [Acidobacteriota bacterium]